MKRYIVFERPNGSSCWTIAQKDVESTYKFVNGVVTACETNTYNIPAQFANRESADMWVFEHLDEKEFFVGEVELP